MGNPKIPDLTAEELVRHDGVREALPKRMVGVYRSGTLLALLPASHSAAQYLNICFPSPDREIYCEETGFRFTFRRVAVTIEPPSK